jgi:polyhydroxyalkanoate synthesis regulator phasin
MERERARRKRKLKERTRMRGKILVSIGGAALLALGLVVGIIVGPSLQAMAAGQQAAQPQVAKGDYCALYEQTVAKDLGVSQSKLESANKDALQTVINQMYADGKITQAQKTKAEQELAQYATNPCVALKQAAAQHQNGQGTQSQAITAARAQIEVATAKALGISQATLQSDLASGKTVAQITKDQGAQKSAVDAAYLGAAQSLLKQAVANGDMTQAQSDMAYSYLQGLVAQGHYPLLDKGDASMAGFAGGQ